MLHRAGWTSKRANGRSLDLRYRYVRPGGDPNGKEGDDFVLGEQAVTNYYRQMYCVGNSDNVVGSDCGGGDERSDEFRPGQLDDPNVDADRNAWRSVVSAANAICSSGGHEFPVQETSIDERNSSSRHGPDAEAHATATLCAVCKEECSRARKCTTCGAYLHHFCSHDMCASLGICGPDGLPLTDFGEAAYCSTQCYKTVTHPASIPTVRPPIGTVACGSTTANAVDAQSSSSLRAASQSSIRPKKAVTKKKAGASINSLENTSKNSANLLPTSSLPNATPKKATSKPRVGKQKIQQAPSKSKIKKTTTTNAAALRNELSRRLHATASNFVNARVAFAPPNEDWMDPEQYLSVGAAFLVGVVTRFTITNEKNADNVCVPTALFEIRWINTAFQTKKHVHQVDESVIARGVRQYVSMQKNSVEFGESWSDLCNMIPKFTDIPTLTEECEEVDDADYREWSSFRSHRELNSNLCPTEVEAIEGLTFSPTASLDQVPGLFTHPDGSITTKLHQDSKKHFGGRASASFFAFLPLSLWKQVVVFSNAHASATEVSPGKPVELDELMKFLGILWYMALIDKGEMRNYWLDDDEASIFPESGSTNLTKIMSWRRFLYIRRHLSFRAKVTLEEVKRDPAAKIRPLIAMLKKRYSRHVVPGRNVAVDEASIACRSKYARHLIVYNPRKPTGKYHFKLYVCCCSTTWIVLSFTAQASLKIG